MTRKAAAAGIAVLVLSCGGAYRTAPSGSTVTLVANPDRIASHGGISDLMAIVTEPAGTDAADGTVVLWSTTLGHVDRETRTQRGIARNRLIADSRSGTAIVTASSGGEAQPPTTTPSPGASASPGTPASPTPSPTPTPPPSTNPGPFSASSVSSRAAGIQNSDSIEVSIGSALVTAVQIRANPSRITISNSTHVIATVLDSFGNPVANVPVFFEVIQNQDFEFFESAGAAVHTDNNGEAEDILRTRRSSGTIIVRAVAVGPGRFVPSARYEIPIL